MKCDELKYENLGDMMPFYPRSTLVIRKQFVDAAIAELKAENRKLKRALWMARANHCKWAALYFWYGYTDKPKSIRYEKAEAKCFNKAKEYE